MAIVLGTALYTYRRRRILTRRRIVERELEIVSRPKILIIYSHDCDAHLACVRALAEFLAEHANADVSLDQYELNGPGEDV